MNDNRSVETLDDIEFIDLQESDISPMVSTCKIKVLYIGKNRNGSFISKDTAIKMAASLRTCPIVGVFREDIEDFGDHGHVITIEDGQVKFSCKTVPYGFVAPDAKVWFQKFKDTDAFGNEEEREYMLTTGYLWTGQFKEAQSVIDEGKGQSMELDPDTLEGKWATDNKSKMDFFIINDATFSKLCILGDDVEPCFEGASITGVESNYTKTTTVADFTYTLYSMMNELKEALGNEGGLEMPAKEDFTENDTSTVEENFVDASAETEGEESSESFAEKKDEDTNDTEEEETPSTTKEEDEDKKKEDASEGACGGNTRKRKYSVEEEDALLNELEELRAFKRKIESAAKDEIINKYHMLSDEDKQYYVDNKDSFSAEQIDEKLALVYVNKYVDFSAVDGKASDKEELEEPALLTFSLDESNGVDDADDNAVLRALREMNNDKF